MSIKRTLVLKYSQAPILKGMPIDRERQCKRILFSFYARSDEGKDMDLGESFPLGVYAKGPIGRNRRFVIFKYGFNEDAGKFIDMEDTEKEAESLAYKEALELKKVIFDNLNFLYNDRYIDETPFGKQSSLEKKI